MIEIREEKKKIVIVDVDYPFDFNRIGVFITKAWIAGGDIVRNMDLLFKQFGFEYTDEEIGGFGSVHLYIQKNADFKFFPKSI